MGHFQLQSLFTSVEHDLYSQNYRGTRYKNLNKKEYKAINALKNNKDIVLYRFLILLYQ